MTNILSERAMLANLSISLPSGRKIDKRESLQVTTSNDADASVARVWKDVLPREALADVKRIAGQARTLHYARTTPWLDSGPRLLSSMGYPDHNKQLRTLGESFEDAKRGVLEGFDSWMDLMQRKLGRLFVAEEIPTLEDLERGFEFRVRYYPVPDAGDFRVELANGQADAIRSDMEESIKEAMRVAQADAWQRIAERVSHMVEKLNAYRPADSKGKMPDGIFRDSLVENVRELVDLLPSLNVTADPDLDKVQARMKEELCSYDAAELRLDEHLRRDVARSAESILSDVSDFIA